MKNSTKKSVVPWYENPKYSLQFWQEDKAAFHVRETLPMGILKCDRNMNVDFDAFRVAWAIWGVDETLQDQWTRDYWPDAEFLPY